MVNAAGWLLNNALCDVHAVYGYFGSAMYYTEERIELKEILFLIGSGLYEAAYIRYVALNPRLRLISRTYKFKDLVWRGQYSLERAVNG